eukprot:g4415.t1
MLVLKNCRMLQMAKTLGAMRHKHLDPDSVNRGIVMHAMRNEGWESGLSLLDGGASEKAHRHLSVQLWKDMLDTSLQPDEISHNAVISAVEKCALWQSALNLLNSMYQVQPTVISYAATARALARVQRWKEVLHLLNEVAKNWIEADSFVFNAAISACECHWHLALHFLRLSLHQGSPLAFAKDVCL